MHLESRRVFGPGGSAVVNFRGRNICVAKPVLNFGDIGVMQEGIGGRCCPECMRAEEIACESNGT